MLSTALCVNGGSSSSSRPWRPHISQVQRQEWRVCSALQVVDGNLCTTANTLAGLAKQGLLGQLASVDLCRNLSGAEHCPAMVRFCEAFEAPCPLVSIRLRINATIRDDDAPDLNALFGAWQRMNKLSGVTLHINVQSRVLCGVVLPAVLRLCDALLRPGRQRLFGLLVSQTRLPSVLVRIIGRLATQSGDGSDWDYHDCSNVDLVLGDHASDLSFVEIIEGIKLGYSACSARNTRLPLW